MSTLTYFVQECPTCGRNLEIRVEYLGRRVACQHCRGHFVASDAEIPPQCSESGLGLLRRADELLELASRRTASTGVSEPASVLD
jgi:DNA-directed RNA polymerase subunit RPC12/RpoP